jgi:hypothetical protein
MMYSMILKFSSQNNFEYKDSRIWDDIYYIRARNTMPRNDAYLVFFLSWDFTSFLINKTNAAAQGVLPKWKIS